MLRENSSKLKALFLFIHLIYHCLRRIRTKTNSNFNIAKQLSNFRYIKFYITNFYCIDFTQMIILKKNSAQYIYFQLILKNKCILPESLIFLYFFVFFHINFLILTFLSSIWNTFKLQKKSIIIYNSMIIITWIEYTRYSRYL